MYNVLYVKVVWCNMFLVSISKGVWCKRCLTGAGAAEMAWEEATGGARFERSLRVTGVGAAEMAWEEATEGERGLSGR